MTEELRKELANHCVMLSKAEQLLEKVDECNDIIHQAGSLPTKALARKYRNPAKWLVASNVIKKEKIIDEGTITYPIKGFLNERDEAEIKEKNLKVIELKGVELSWLYSFLAKTVKDYQPIHIDEILKNNPNSVVVIKENRQTPLIFKMKTKQNYHYEYSAV